MGKAPVVSIVKVNGCSIERAVNESIDLVEGFTDLQDKRSVSIKPNLCSLKSVSSGSTTDPRIVEAVIKRVNAETTCKINIVETNNFQASADKTFRTLGFLDLAKKYPNVECINLSNDVKLKASLNGEVFSTLLIPETMLFSDYLINIAKLKTHVDYRYTGALKNAYGFLLSSRALYHGFMHKALVDLNRVYKPDLSIIDAVIGMEGFGPTGGSPKYVGVILASKDPVAADTVAAQIAGIKPSKIKYLKYAEEKGIGKSRDIEVVGCSIEDVKTNFKFIPLRLYYIGRLSLTIQRFSKQCFNFARLLSLVRSTLSTISFSTLEERSSYMGLLHLAKDTTFRIDG